MEDNWTTEKKRGKVTYTMAGEVRDIFHFTAQVAGEVVKFTAGRRYDVQPTRAQAENEFAEYLG